MKDKTGSKPKSQRLKMAITKYNKNELAPVSLSMPPWEIEDGQKVNGDGVTLRRYNPAPEREAEDDLPAVLRQKV